MRKFFLYLVIVSGVMLILLTAASLLYNTSLWYIQILNFPRLQFLIGLLIVLILYLLLSRKWHNFGIVFISGLFCSAIVQAYILFPYSPMADQKVPQVDLKSANQQNVFKLMIANVLMSNRESGKLLEIINKEDPTFVLTMEVNHWWTAQLKQLDARYPYQILYPVENTYGMALYSKLPLRDKQIMLLNHTGVPSFLSTVTLPGGAVFTMLNLHPVAPKSSEHPDNVNQKENALIEAAKVVKSQKLPVVAAGDFNDVGWSHNTTTFIAHTGLKDLRYGRGLYNTFDAQSLLMRWPLDYIFVSSQFRMIEIKTLPKFGSDHFAYFAELTLQ